jgi:hypothetical protein
MIGLCIGVLIVALILRSVLFWELVCGLGIFTFPVAVISGEWGVALTAVGLVVASVFAFASLTRRRYR